jgi:hypothetical protein
MTVWPRRIERSVGMSYPERQNVKYYHEFSRSGRSFSERGATVDEFCTAIGMIALSFSELEDCLGEAIDSLIGGNDGTGSIVAAELSFRMKVNLFASLVRHRAGGRSFTVPNAAVSEVMQELCNNIFKAEELRNAVLHSSWIESDMFDGKVVRRKATAKSKHGFRITEEEVGSGYLLDIVEFTGGVAGDVVGFMSELQRDGGTTASKISCEHSGR